MNRREFKQLAKVRLEEAKSLLDRGHFDGAYYLSGYVVECALKACIAKLTKKDDFPPTRRFVEESYTHQLGTLVKTARLEEQLEQEEIKDRDFESNWARVKRWTEQSRYERHSETESRELFTAIAEKEHGVLQWVKRFW